MVSIEKKDLLFDGNEKQIYSTAKADEVIIRYKDVATAYAGVKRARFKGLGCLNNQISGILFQTLEKEGISTHYIAQNGEREQLCRKISLVDLLVVVHNRIAGSLAHRLGLEEGFRTPNVVVEFRYNNDALGNPPINGDEAVALGMVNYDEVDYIIETAHKVNKILSARFDACGIELVDFKLEFGRYDGRLIVSDELSPDRCRLRDKQTGDILDKDRFRHDMGDIYRGYEEVLKRLNA
ncbi:MAG: phosphoribosylaminoimidazolesuccinocarboxamide synthase [Bacteroidales bacterium]|nr:phosphoribosylaminoimidazolesuccinocarboxamide synthase [Bacteroidales bacterium]